MGFGAGKPLRTGPVIPPTGKAFVGGICALAGPSWSTRTPIGRQAPRCQGMQAQGGRQEGRPEVTREHRGQCEVSFDARRVLGGPLSLAKGLSRYLGSAQVRKLARSQRKIGLNARSLCTELKKGATSRTST